MGGLFITFEGLDGSGKSTHLATASSWFEAAGVSAVTTREPGGTRLGMAIRDTFLDPQWGRMDGLVETMLIFASRRQHLLEVIDPALAEGSHVLCDRFTDSTRAYQGAGRAVGGEAIDAIDRLATGGRKPDRTLYFDLPAEAARERGHSSKRASQPRGIDRLDAEDLAFYARVREAYLQMLAADPARFVMIDSSGTVEETEHQVRAALTDLLEP